MNGLKKKKRKEGKREKKREPKEVMPCKELRKEEKGKQKLNVIGNEK